MSRRLDRRKALKLGGLALGGAALAASTPGEALAHGWCGPASPLSASAGMVLTNVPTQPRSVRAAARAPVAQPPDPTMQVLTRRPGQPPESPFEKPVIVPAAGERDPARHAWADAGFATDIMAEHALFIALLIPPEAGRNQRAEALYHHELFMDLLQRIAASPPPSRGELRLFAGSFVERAKPFIEFKARLADEQRSGQLRSLIWPLFLDHIRNEAERWARRLDQLAGGQSEFDRAEVITFWVNIMEEHARFVAHLLDPDEFALIDQAMQLSRTGRDLEANPAPALQDPSTLVSVGQTIIDFKTEAARGIEAARIKSIIDPRLADHVRREAVKFADELKRVV